MKQFAHDHPWMTFIGFGVLMTSVRWLAWEKILRDNPDAFGGLFGKAGKR
jgi:hypothetical protein